MSTQTSSAPSARLSLPANIRRVLDELSRKIFLVRVAQFPLLVAIVLPLLWLMQGLVDWIFNLSWGARLVLLLANAAVVGWLFYQHVILPARRRLNLRTAALLAERKFPQFRTSLISAVEFGTGDSATPPRSSDLIQILLGHVSRQVDQTDIVRGIVSTKFLRKLLLGALAAMVAVAGITWYFQPRSLTLARRIFLSHEPLPTRTTVVPLTKDLTLTTGSDAELSARAEGIVPKNGRLVVVYADNRKDVIPVSASPVEPGVFTVTLRNVLQPFRYRFELNDGAGPDFQVKTRTLPALATTRFVQGYPGYLNRPEAEMASGGLSLIAGGGLRIEAEATQPLKSATLELIGLNQTLRMDSGDNIANLQRRLEADEAKFKELTAEFEKLQPEAAAVTAAQEAGQKAVDEARKAMESAPGGTEQLNAEKQRLGRTFERLANEHNKVRGNADRVRDQFNRTKRDREDLQRRIEEQKKQLEKMIAETKPADAAAAEKQKRILRADIPIPREGLTGLSIHLVNEDGLESENDPVYRVNLIPDKPPVVTMSEPKPDRKTVLANDKVRLKFSARDDFRLERVALKYVVYRLNADGVAVAAEEGSIPMTFPKETTTLSREYVWDLASFLPPLFEGCTVTYWIEAADHYTLYSPGAGTSRRKSLAVVSPEEKRAELLSEMEKAAKEIERLSEGQRKANEKTDTNLRR